MCHALALATVTSSKQTSLTIFCTSSLAFISWPGAPQAILYSDQSRETTGDLKDTTELCRNRNVANTSGDSHLISVRITCLVTYPEWTTERLQSNMADVKAANKLRWKKSEKYRRIRRKETRAKEDKKIKELEDRCRDVSCYYDDWFLKI